MPPQSQSQSPDPHSPHLPHSPSSLSSPLIISQAASPQALFPRESSQTPFLFFVALGVGILFVNAWFILRAKHFRRNANLTASRSHELQNIHIMDQQGNIVEVIYVNGGVYVNPAANARRPAAARRLLTQEQLESLFPIQKYKDWSSQQEQQGLPSEGGLSDSAAQALEKSIMANTPPQLPQEAGQLQDGNSTTAVVEELDLSEDKNKTASASASKSTPTVDTQQVHPEPDTTKDPEEESDLRLSPVHSSSGDICVICLESLEPEDDIRALSCHHVFHSDCIVPWLTTRRALCPLCKRDYFVGNPESEEQQQALNNNNNSNNSNNSSNNSNTSPRASTSANGRPSLPTRASTSSRSSIQATRHISDTPQLMYPWEHRRPSTSSSTTRQHMIGTTGVAYEESLTPIYDEMRLEFRDLMSRIRRSRQARRAARTSSPASEEPGSATPPIEANNDIINDNSQTIHAPHSHSFPPSSSVLRPPSPPADLSSPNPSPNTRDASPQRGWKFWKTFRPTLSEV